MRSELCVRTLNGALAAYPGLRGAILHSDRGSQYTSGAYRAAVENNGIRQSMNSDGGCCHDNLDPECLIMEELKTVIWRYFMSYWSRRPRISSANDGLPPVVKRQRYYAAFPAAA